MPAFKYYNPDTDTWEYLLQGPVGDTGPTGPTGVSTFVRVHHLADPNVARPNAQFVEWVGSVAPVNGTTDDTWINTA